ncbi:CopD family protein [Jatrophihabitans sp. DSM 45814]
MRRLCIALLIFALAPFGWLATASSAAAAPVVSTVPAANSEVQTAPTRILITPGNGAKSGTARVLDSAGKVAADGQLLPVGDTLSMAMPALEAGVFTVAWSAGGAKGAFAFDIRDGAGSPETVTQPKPKVKLSPLKDNLVEWVPIISIMTFVGALALRFLVTAPAARRAGAQAVAESTDRRLVRVAAIAIALFVPTTFAQMAYADGTFDFGSVWPSFGADGAGHLLGARLFLTLLAAVIVIPAAFRPGRALVPVMAVGLTCGLLELAAREIPSAVPANVPRGIFNTVLYIGHLVGSAVWIGGLVGLVALFVRGGVAADARASFWPVAIRRFSAVALISVATLTLSGLWLYWVHVAGLNQLVTTLYGRTLLVKLIVFGGLLALGAFNQFWLMPQIDGLRSTGEDRSLTRILLSHFRATIAIEVVLGLLVLFIAPLLSGSARNQAFQASPAALTRTASAAGNKVSLTPSGLQPGLIDYTIAVDSAVAPQLVSVGFGSTKLGVAEQQVAATRIGPDLYRVSGYYTPAVGNWQVSVRLDDAAPAKFQLAISNKPAKLAKSAAPAVRWTTWVAGFAWTLGVLLALLTALRVSKWLAARRDKPTPPPVSETERQLVDA